MEGVDVRMCNGSCISAVTDSDGNFYHSFLSSLRYSFDVVHYEEGKSYSTPLVPYDITDGEHHELSTAMVLPEFTDSSALDSTSATYPAGDGLSVTLSADDLDLPFGVSEAFIQGVRLDESQYPPLGTLDGNVLAVWYLGTWDADAAADPLSFEVRNDFGLAAGDTVNINLAGYLDYDWVDGGTATVSSDGESIVSDSGSGLSTLTTLVLTN